MYVYVYLYISVHPLLGLQVWHCDDCKMSPWVKGPMCNIIGAVVRLKNPVPSNGNLSIWGMSPELVQKVVDEVPLGPVTHVCPDGKPNSWTGTVARPPLCLIEKTHERKVV